MRRVLVSHLTWAPVVVAAFLLVGLAGTTLAQTDVTTARISGTVKDVDGGALPGVTVEAKNQDTGYVVRSVTDGRGFFRLLNLPTGTYTIAAELQGFATVSKSDVRLVLSAAPTVDFTMQLAAAAESITVTSDVPLVEVTNTAAATTMQTEQLANLPIAGRDFKALVLLTPETRNDRERGNLSLSGQRGINTNVTVDGVDNNNAFFGGTTGTAEGRAPLSISQESIKEFSVITNGASVEFGRSAGGFVNVITKSGTNQFRGSVFVYNQPNSMVADRRDGTELNNQEKWQYGASLGGPIIKDKLFFFSSFDNQKRDEDVIVNTSMRGLDPTFVARYPIFDAEDYTSTQDGRVLFGRFDFQASAAHRFTFRGNYTDYEGENGTGTYSTNGIGHNGIEHLWTRSYVGSYSGMFGDSILNDTNLQYVREDTPRDNMSAGDAYPEFQVRGLSGGTGYFGGVSYLPITAAQDRKEIADTLTYLMGDHVFKAGFDYNTTNMDQVFKGNWRGVYIFNSANDLYAGNWSQFRQFLPIQPGDTVDDAGRFNHTQKETALFLQDQWYITPSLTASFGVRWEKLNNPDNAILNYEKKGADGYFTLDGNIPDVDNQWSPRIGLTWSPGGSGKAVVRFTAGRFFSRTPAILFAQLYTSNGVQGQQYVATSGSFPCAPGRGTAFDPNNLAPVEACGLQAPPGVFVINKDFTNPYTDRVTIGGEYEIMKDTALSIDATWAETMHLERLSDINLAYARNADGTIKLSPINGQPMFLGTGTNQRPNSKYARITMYTSDGRSEYYGISTVLQRRFTESLYGFLSVTYSKDKDNDSNERNYSGINAEDVYRFRKEEWGYSARDQRWKMALNTVWNTPWWGLSVSGMYRYYTGQAYTATTSSDANKDGNYNDRPTINGKHFDRNTFRGPDYMALDLRVQKKLGLGPGNLAIIAECFNVFNNSNKSVGSWQWGDGQTASASFGKVNQVTSSVRTFQFALRFDF